MPPIDLQQPADRPETRIVAAGIGIDGIHPASPHLAGLAAKYRLMAPWHPGCGHSETVSQFHDVRDLAIFYTLQEWQFALPARCDPPSASAGYGKLRRSAQRQNFVCPAVSCSGEKSQNRHRPCEDRGLQDVKLFKGDAAVVNLAAPVGLRRRRTNRIRGPMPGFWVDLSWLVESSSR